MTEQEKRYVAEKMLGWKRRDDGGPYYEMVGGTQIDDDAVDFTSEEWLGPLWKALCEVVEERWGHQTYANLRTREERTRVWLGVTPASPAWDREYYDNPNLAVIAAHKALEGV